MEEIETLADNLTVWQPQVFPTEIWIMIAKHLDLKDLQALRLVARELEGVGLERLFETFIFRPDKRDIERAERMGRETPTFLHKVKCVRFETGIMEVRRATGALAHVLYNDRRMYSPGFEKLAFKAVQEYARWKSLQKKVEQNYVHGLRLTLALRGMKNIDTVEVIKRASSFKSTLLLRSWMCDFPDHEFTRSRAELVVLLEALVQASIHLKHFRHDEIPINFFRRLPGKIASISPCLESLESLHLSFVSPDGKPSRFWRGLRLFMRAAPKLKSLRLGYTPWYYEDGFLDPSMSHIKLQMVQMIPLKEVFEDFTWEYLKTLRFDGLLTCEKSLRVFLLRHCSSLRELFIHNLVLRRGSFKMLFSVLKYQLSLTELHLYGVLKKSHGRQETWYFPTPLDLIEPQRYPGYDYFLDGRSPSKTSKLDQQDIVIDRIALPPDLYDLAVEEETHYAIKSGDVDEQEMDIIDKAEHWRELPTVFNKEDIEESDDDPGDSGYDSYGEDEESFDEDEEGNFSESDMEKVVKTMIQVLMKR